MGAVFSSGHTAKMVARVAGLNSRRRVTTAVDSAAVTGDPDLSEGGAGGRDRARAWPRPRPQRSLGTLGDTTRCLGASVSSVIKREAGREHRDPFRLGRFPLDTPSLVNSIHSQSR